VVSANVDKPRTVEYKSTMDLVTDTDKASEAAVLKARARPRAHARSRSPRRHARRALHSPGRASVRGAVFLRCCMLRTSYGVSCNATDPP